MTNINKYRNCSWIKYLAYTLFVCCLTACSHETDPPTVNIDSRFPSSTQAYRPVNNLPGLAWWTTCHDPFLNQYLKKSLHRNLDIRVAIAHLEAAQGELKQVKLSWIPTLKLLAGYSTFPAFGSPAGFFGAWPYYTVNILQLYKQQRQATYNVQYYQAMVEGVRLTLIGQTVGAYFTLIAQQEQLALLNQLQQALKKIISLYHYDIQIGLKNNVDIAALLTESHQIEAQIKATQHNVTLSQNALHFLLDENPGVIASSHHFSTLPIDNLKPGSLPATVLNNRPDVKMALYALKRSHADIDIAYANFFPLLQLDQFVGESHLPHSQFAQFTDAYVNANLTPSTFGLISTQQSRYQAERLNYVKTIRRVMQEVDNDFSANHQYRAYYDETLAAQKAFQYRYELQSDLVKTGLLSSEELLEVQIQLDKLKLSTNQAKLQLAMSLVLLYQDLAGGYRVS